MVLVFCTSSLCMGPSLILIPFQDMARPGINYEKKLFMGR